MRRHPWLALVLLLLVACGAPTAARSSSSLTTPTVPVATATTAANATPTPTATGAKAPPPTATATAPPPTATSVPPTPTAVRKTATDSDGLCQMTIPTGFAEESPGSGYFPALDKSGFVALDAPDTAGGANSFDQALVTVLVGLKTVLPGYSETNVVRAPGSLRVEFAATPDGGAGRGVAYFKEFGPIVCGGTLFLTNTSTLPFDTTLQEMVASLQVVKGAQPRPTATPLPPTPTPIPPTATPVPPTPKPLPTSTATTAPRASSGQTWHGVPIYPGSIVYQDHGDNVVFAVDAPAATVRAWYDRTWRAAGMTFMFDYPYEGYTFKVYRYGNDYFGFTTVDVAGGLSGAALLHVRP